MQIKSDNKAIEKNVQYLKDTIEEYGGYIDPEVVIRCENGELSVEKHGLGGNTEKPLIALPGELLLQTEHLGIGVKNDELFLDPDKDKLTDIQLKMADTMFELYNLTTKIPNHKKSCCWFQFLEAPDLLEKLLKARSLNEVQSKYMSFTNGTMENADYDKALAETYVKTRTIGHKQISSDNEEEAMMTTDIMPIVDFINHHQAGGCFNFNKDYDKNAKDKEFLVLHDSRPLPDSNECFAFYNMMDALDSFIAYGFPDHYAPFIRSIPIEFDVPNCGKISFKGMHAGMNKGKLQKNIAGLRPYIPQTFSSTPEHLELTHIYIPAERQAPHALRRVLRLVISNKSASSQGPNLSPKQVWDTVLEAEHKIVYGNIDFYRSLLADLEQEDASGTRKELIGVIKSIAELQLVKLYKYSFEASKSSDEAADGDEKIAAAE